MTERLRQLNAELAQEPIPQDDDRERSIKFSEDPVSLVVPPPEYPSDAEEEGQEEGQKQQVQEGHGQHGQGLDQEDGQGKIHQGAQQTDAKMEEAAPENNDRWDMDSGRSQEDMDNPQTVDEPQTIDDPDQSQDQGHEDHGEDRGANDVVDAGNVEDSGNSYADGQQTVQDKDEKEEPVAQDTVSEEPTRNRQGSNDSWGSDKDRRGSLGSNEGSEKAEQELYNDTQEESVENGECERKVSESEKQRGEDDDEKVLIERNGKFELHSAKDLTPEEREIYGVQVEEETHQPHPPEGPRPATADGTGARRKHQQKRAQSAPQQSSLNGEDFVYCSPYGLSKEEKKRLAKEQRDKEKYNKDEKERTKREDERNKEECEDAFQAWLKKKRQEAKERQKDERDTKKKENEERKQEEVCFETKSYTYKFDVFII